MPKLELWNFPVLSVLVFFLKVTNPGYYTGFAIVDQAIGVSNVLSCPLAVANASSPCQASSKISQFSAEIQRSCNQVSQFTLQL